MTDTNTVIELPARDPIYGPLHKKLNKGVMVQWINADLLDRCGNDVRKSIVFYDEAMVFEYAIPAWPEGIDREDLLRRLYAGSNIRFWSKGIK